MNQTCCQYLKGSCTNDLQRKTHFSVCIANTIGIDVIGDAIESIYEQNFRFPVEIIIHNDASSEGSFAYIKEKFPNVILLTSERNVGFCISNNHMVVHAKGDSTHIEGH